MEMEVWAQRQLNNLKGIENDAATSHSPAPPVGSHSPVGRRGWRLGGPPAPDDRVQARVEPVL